jgi:hypothetical protein
MEGLYSIPNHMQESIATMELSYPHSTRVHSMGDDFSSVTGQVYTQSANPDPSFDPTSSGETNRQSYNWDAFMQNDEILDFNVLDDHQYNGFIPVTELRGTRFWQSTLGSGVNPSTTKTYHYQIDSSSLTAASVPVPVKINRYRNYECSYFYPFSNHQLSVLREESTVILDLDKESELFDGIGEKGFVVIPSNTKLSPTAEIIAPA